MLKLDRDPTSPTGTALWKCEQAERRAWIEQFTGGPVDFATLTTRPEWPKAFEVDPIDDFAPGLGGSTCYRLQYRTTPDAQGFYVLVDRCRSKQEAIERGFIIACVNRWQLRRGAH